ncbi:hypothetical protein SAMN02745133_03181 [Desulforamulus putei DSM 12395]|uniref:ORC1/DEAH AAA+ ATPase domain-containing protein n=1 Tax=Desulforamulus putei DSM 12395 TaxID=1121429 RepID=A0A1M5DF74_9FIRM|nr:hypothetical protein SAMN02745133_03181 [Desulforamulus putei DSM 12395]
MYKAFYSLSREPFVKGLKTADSFVSAAFAEARARLDYLKKVKGMGLLVGEPGAGKTFTLRAFADSLNPSLYKVIYFPYLKEFCRQFNVVIEEVDDRPNKEPQEELVEDMIAIVTGFSARLYGKRGGRVAKKLVQVKFNLNSRQANDAVYDAQSTIKSQYELVKLHYANALAKVEFTQKRITKAKSSKKKANLQKRLEKEQRKLADWQKHLEAKTFPTIVFGGKRLFLERCKGNITREEWQEARSNRYLSRGDKTKGGNLNTRLYEVDGQIYLDIAAEQVPTEKSVRYNRITVLV